LKDLDPEPDWDPYKQITDPDPGGPKTYGTYGSGTMVKSTEKKCKRKEKWIGSGVDIVAANTGNF
jgi:hypothetical protein